MKVRVLRPFWLGGEVKAIGAVVEVPDALGKEVVFGGKAERVIDPPAKPSPSPAPIVEVKVDPPQKKQPFTTKSASALVGKKGD